MAISTRKKNLLAEGKELGLNLDSELNCDELQKLIDEEKSKQEEKPKEQKSSKTGEY